LAILDLFDDPADLAVVEPDGLPRPDVVEHLGNRAADRGGGQQAPATVKGRGAARLEVAAQDEQVPLPEGDGALTRRQLADAGVTVLALGHPAVVTQDRIRDEVSRLGRLRPAPAVADVDDREGAPGVARVGQFHALPRAEAGK